MIMVNCGLKSSLKGRIVSQNFVSLCRRAPSLMYTIFNKVNSISDMSNIYKFHGILRIFTRVTKCKDARTGKQLNKLISKTFFNFVENGK